MYPLTSSKCLRMDYRASKVLTSMRKYCIMRDMAGETRKGIPNKAKKAVELLKKNEVKKVSNAMRLAGYSERSIQSMAVGRTKEYKEYLQSIDDQAITDQWNEYAQEFKEATDKRLAFDVGKELIKLKERNPDTKDDSKGNMPILNIVFKDSTLNKPEVDYEQ